MEYSSEGCWSWGNKKPRLAGLYVIAGGLFQRVFDFVRIERNLCCSIAAWNHGADITFSKDGVVGSRAFMLYNTAERDAIYGTFIGDGLVCCYGVAKFLFGVAHEWIVVITGIIIQVCRHSDYFSIKRGDGVSRLFTCFIFGSLG